MSRYIVIVAVAVLTFFACQRTENRWPSASSTRR